MTWDTPEREYLERADNGVTGDIYYREIARGNVDGASQFNAYGERTTAGAETNRVIWPNGVFSLPSSSGVQMSLVSTTANDTSDGAGIRTVHLHYLDASLNEQTETVTLNGTSSVTTTATDIRFIQCMHMATAGSGGAADGDITAENGGTTYSKIAAGEVRCSSSMRMVPAGKRLLVTGAGASAISGTSAAKVLVRLVSSTLDDEEFTNPLVLIPHGAIGVQDNAVSQIFNPPIAFTEGNVFGMTQTTDKAATIAGTWFGVLENAE